MYADVVFGWPWTIMSPKLEMSMPVPNIDVVTSASTRADYTTRTSGWLRDPSRYGCNLGTPQAGRQAASVSRMAWTPLRLTVHLDHATFGLEYIDAAAKIVQIVERGHQAEAILVYI